MAARKNFNKITDRKMKILIIKTSSLGDVIHALPALTDAGRHVSNIHFDWVVEEAFAEVPSWHPLVDKVIPVALRRWRKQPLKTWQSGEWKKFLRMLQAEQYDLVIDAQGLVKSAFLAYFAKGLKCGLDRASAWEPLATLVYQRKYQVDPSQHAVTRMRQLFARVFNYSVTDKPDCGIDLNRLSLTQSSLDKKNIVFLHGTTWATKHWPEVYWQQLAEKIVAAGYRIQLPWGNQTELERAQRIAKVSAQIEVLPRSNLTALAQILVNAKAAVAVDTGLGHLAAALKVPTISLYGPTDPKETGTEGENQIHLSATFPCAPCQQTLCTYNGPREVEPACFSQLSPDKVWEQLQKIL